MNGAAANHEVELTEGSFMTVAFTPTFPVITAVVRDANGTTCILVTENGEMPLNEYGEADIAGAATNGQPIAGFVYRHRPLSRATLLFLTVSWTGVLGAVLLEINQVIMRTCNHLIRKTEKR